MVRILRIAGQPVLQIGRRFDIGAGKHLFRSKFVKCRRIQKLASHGDGLRKPRAVSIDVQEFKLHTGGCQGIGRAYSHLSGTLWLLEASVNLIAIPPSRLQATGTQGDRRENELHVWMMRALGAE